MIKTVSNVEVVSQTLGSLNTAIGLKLRAVNLYKRFLFGVFS